MKQEVLTRNNLHKSSLYDQQSLSIFGGISPLQLLSSLVVFQPTLLTSSFPSYAQASPSSSNDREANLLKPLFCNRDFTREENFSSYPSGFNQGVSGLSCQALEKLLHYFQCLVFFTKVQGFAFMSLSELFGYFFTAGAENSTTP